MHTKHTRLASRLLATLALVGGSLVLLGNTGQAVEQEPNCDNPDIDTPTSSGILMGTDGDDVIAGTPGPDFIQGNGGDDYICGNGGNDVISGGAGDDAIFGGEGNDLVDGGPGADDIIGGAGHDLVNGGADDDACYDVAVTELANCEQISVANGEANQEAD